MFLGEYRLNFTGSGRVLLPKKLREVIVDEKLVLSRGLDGCIWGFTTEGWEKEAQKQLSTSLDSEESRNLRRYLFSAAEVSKLDEQGRFVIPKALLDFASLALSVVMVGAGDHFEIWNPTYWGQLADKFKGAPEKGDV